MVGIGMPHGFEWLFILLGLAVPIALIWLVIQLARGRGVGRGFDVPPRRDPGDPPEITAWRRNACRGRASIYRA